MRSLGTLLCTTLALGITASAQTSTPPSPPASTITTGTQLVVLDITVQDRQGHPIHGLKQTDFLVEEKKVPQAPKSFDEHAVADPTSIKLPAMPKLPPGTFTDYTPVPPNGTLNILLLDALNTPMKDQAYVRYQLQQYVKHAVPGTNMAIFGLTSHLILLQGFSADPEILKNVVEHKLIARASVLLDDPAGTNTDPNLLSDSMSEAGASAATVANMQQFEAQNAVFQTELRTRYTLEAFNALAHYLSGFPGRKNILWFSGAFPLTIFPDASLEDPFAAMTDASGGLKETTALLDRARVAVYPIDARGLQTVPVFDASRSGAGMTPQRMAREISNFSNTNTQEHMAMAQIAEDTGGQAFYNTNGLAEAVTKALTAGSNFYTLTYTPANREQNGDYRKVHVQLQGEAAGHGYHLSYRNGYYAGVPQGKGAASTPAGVAAALPTPPPSNTIDYSRSSMQRGAPTPSDILFKVRVLPHSTTTEDAVAPHNIPNPDGPLKPPFRRYDVDVAAIASDFRITLGSDGLRHGAMDFLAYVYSDDGVLLNVERDTLDLALKPDIYAQLLKSGVGFHMEVSAPAKSAGFLRIAVHDAASNRIGVVEVPTVSVAHLAPPPPPPAAAQPVTPAPASTPK